MANAHPYSAPELLRFVERLGKEFETRGLAGEANSLRVYYAAVRKGRVDPSGALRVAWSPGHVLEWLKILGLEPYKNFYRVLPFETERCPGCTRSRMSVTVELSCGPIRRVRCRACKEVWVEEIKA